MAATNPTAEATTATAPATWQPRLVAFVCNWCTYSGADLAGTSRTTHRANVRIVRLPCSGRIDPHFIIRAFEQGADGVLVSGCHPGDCHYTAGNYYARRKFTIFRALVDFLGLEPERLQFSWVSAAEGKKWAEVVDDVTAGLLRVGPLAPAWGQSDGEPPALPTSSAEATPPALDLTAALREVAGGLLADGSAQMVVGFGAGALPGRMRAVFADSVAKVDQLVWNEHCTANLATYLTREMVKKRGTIGLVVKGCDARSVVGLLQEKQLAREQVKLIGVECHGVAVDGALAAKCRTCDVHLPLLADAVVSASDQPSAPAPTDGAVLAAELAALEALPAAERRAYWQAQFDRCLRCYACRAACPLCYCAQCIADKNRPQWIPTSAHGAGNLAWNLFRALHLAGRCVGCNECSRACPAGLRLDLLNARLAQVVEREFGYVAGRDPEAAPPLTTFRETDHEDFIR